jgi:CheY-like chemotaxis protein
MGGSRDAAAGGGPRTILVVEDEGSIRGLIHGILRGEGHAVIAAGSAEEALREIEGHPGRIDLLLSDVGLPGMDGFALAEEVRRRRPEVRALLVSGHAEAAAPPRSGLPAWVHYLGKPFAPRDLVAKVSSVFAAPP